MANALLEVVELAPPEFGHECPSCWTDSAYLRVVLTLLDGTPDRVCRILTCTTCGRGWDDG